MSMWLKIAGVYGCSAVGLGAIGAHALPTRREQKIIDVFKTGTHYHLIHTVILASAAMALPVGRKKTVVCSLFATGILLFSGGCYAVTYFNTRDPYSKPTPIGGTLLMAGWLALAFMA